MFKFGIDEISGKLPFSKIGLVTNLGSVTSGLEINIDFMIRKGYNISKIFTPEHGLYGSESNGSEISNSEYNSIPTISLYGEKVKPTVEDMDDLDLLVFDLQDAGVRFYTYLSTLFNVIEASSKYGIPVFILDRPNPINGTIVDGNVLSKEHISFVGTDTIPIRYGMTIGELGQFFNRHFNGDVKVIRMSGYRRNSYLDHLINWFIPPSLNLPTIDSLLNYSSMCLLEATDISVGRGTPYPFVQFGKPGLNDLPLNIPGLKLRKTRFIPLTGEYSLQNVDGFFLHILDRKIYNPFLLTLGIFVELFRKDFIEINEQKLARLYGSNSLIKMIRNGSSEVEIIESWSEDLLAFKEESENYKIYK